jgi:hypothetical protein
VKQGGTLVVTSKNAQRTGITTPAACSQADRQERVRKTWCKAPRQKGKTVIALTGAAATQSSETAALEANEQQVTFAG